MITAVLAQKCIAVNGKNMNNGNGVFVQEKLKEIFSVFIIFLSNVNTESIKTRWQQKKLLPF